MVVTTTNNIEGWQISKYYQPISSNVVVGANIFSDIAASWTDFFGGRSGNYERRLTEIYEQALQNLSDRARNLGANCIIGLKVDFGEVSGKGNQMFMVSVIGTPVTAMKFGEQDTTSEKEILTYYDGDLIERKVRAKSIIGSLQSGTHDISLVHDNTLDFIVQSGLIEFLDLVVEMCGEWYFSSESNQKYDRLYGYFRNIDKSQAVDRIYDFVAENGNGASRFVDVIFQYDLIDYEKLKVLFESEHLEARKCALKILAKGKQVYEDRDFELMKQYLKSIPVIFTPVVTYEEVKGMFSSNTKEKWRCECGTRNTNDTKHCGSCGNDIYGFHFQEKSLEKNTSLIGERLAVIAAL